MFGNSKQKALVGLDIGSSSMKAVELRSTKHGYELVNFGMETLGQDTVVDGAIMDAPWWRRASVRFSSGRSQVASTWPRPFPATR